MMAVPRRSQRAADEEADTHVNGTVEPAEEAAETVRETSEAETTRLPVLADENALATPHGPVARPDPGLYAVLGLDPSAPDHEIQTTYRRRAAKLIGNGSDN